MPSGGPAEELWKSAMEILVLVRRYQDWSSHKAILPWIPKCRVMYEVFKTVITTNTNTVSLTNEHRYVSRVKSRMSIEHFVPCDTFQP